MAETSPPGPPGPPTAEATRRWRDIAAFSLVVLIWGSTWFVIKLQAGPEPASWNVTWRFVLAGAAMFGLAAARGERLWLDREGMAVALAVGFTQFFANYELVYWAEDYLTSGLVACVYALLMLPNALLARVFLGARVSARFLAGSVVAVAGVALLFLQETRNAAVLAGHGAGRGAAGIAGHPVAWGVMLSLFGLLAASIANVLQATPSARRQQMVPLLAWAMTMGAVIDAGAAYVTSGPPVWVGDAHYWLAVFYLAIVGSVVTFPLYFGLIRSMGAGRAAYNGVAVPVVAMALSTVFEHYRWNVVAVGGAMLAMLGLLIALSRRTLSPGSR